MRIGLVGFGYWGKIVWNNLNDMDYEVTICDPFLHFGIKDYRDLDVDCVFVLTPVDSHYEVCSHFLNKGVHVFCEKPLVTTSDQAVRLYRKAKQNNVCLFVDWIFTFNNQVNLIKKLVEDKKYGNLKSVTMNRLNLGPERKDVSAKYDLACHDVSIVSHIFNNKAPNKAHWLGYKRKKTSTVNDSCFGFLNFGQTMVQINTSWHYGKKDRTCIFEFEKGFLYWEDAEQKLEINGKSLWKDGPSPLENSIKAFLKKGYDHKHQEKLTINVLKVLENENTF